MTSDQPKLFNPGPRLYEPDVVVFAGDGEPRSPEMHAARLAEISATKGIEPDRYALGGVVEELEKRFADIFGKPAAIWLPTGSMANHLALRRHAGIAGRVIVQEQSHVYHDEGDSLQRLGSLNVIPLGHGRTGFTVEELERAIDESVNGRVVNPIGALQIESPVRRQAGKMVSFDDMQKITALCREREIPTHLDGARLYMMSAATDISIRDYADLFDSAYVSMYKYFGAPFGAILAGTEEFIEGMYHERRMYGGGLSSASLPAALALDGVDGFEERFDRAMTQAAELFEELNEITGVEINTFESGSNNHEIHLDESIDSFEFASALAEHDVFMNNATTEWRNMLLQVNTTILRKPNSEILEAFADAASKTRN